MRKVDRPEDPDDGEQPRFHPTMQKLLLDIESYAKPDAAPADRALMKALHQYYLESEIAHAAPGLLDLRHSVAI